VSLALTVALVGLTSCALALLLLPLLLRRGGAAARDAYNLAVYRDQLAEVERDVGRGLLGAEQAEAARTEIGRRILALGSDEGGIIAEPKRVAAATVAILLLPIVALLIYAALGAPLLPDRPFTERRSADPTAAGADPVDIQTALAQLREHLKAHPDDLTGWLLLGRSEIGVGQYREGATAYGRAADLSGRRADVMGDWGEAQVLAADGAVTPAARDAFAAALKDPTAAPQSRYYLALAQMQQGDTAGALAAWRALAADSPVDATWLPMVRQRIAEAAAKLGGDIQPSGQAASSGSMPPLAAVAAAAKATEGASADERRTMIDAMVAKLAARLERQPDDADGWAQLGRSYMVIERPEKARDAFARALKLRPGDTTLQQAFAAAGSAAAANPAATVPK
jgi:cytochrome c-type biogenesis protein CcmH